MPIENQVVTKTVFSARRTMWGIWKKICSSLREKQIRPVFFYRPRSMLFLNGHKKDCTVDVIELRKRKDLSANSTSVIRPRRNESYVSARR